MFLYDINFIDFEEPFTKVIHQGMILNKGEKMSKSKGNTISLEGYDSDEIRFYLMFIGHYFDGGSWNDQNINGIQRFIFKMKEEKTQVKFEKIEVKTGRIAHGFIEIIEPSNISGKIVTRGVNFVENGASEE
jgi:leucyl-tRNA synthetase